MSVKTKKILIVDDSDLIRHALKNFFNEYDVEVIECQNGLEGIQKALEHIPQLIFLDLLMPNFDGIKMLQVIKIIDNLKRIPVIVVSGNTSKANVFAALEAGADKIISKPIQKESILDVVDEFLGSEFLMKIENINPVEQENKEILGQLEKIFLTHYPLKKHKITSALETRKKDVLFNLIHDMKGAGGTIGYPVISVVCNDIEKALLSGYIDWKFITAKCEQIFNTVDKIESSKIILERKT